MMPHVLKEHLNLKFSKVDDEGPGFPVPWILELVKKINKINK
jgi:hypothetical protein